MKYQDLVDSIQDNLVQYEYTDTCEALSVRGADGVVIRTPRRRMVRYLCGVLTLWDGCCTPKEAIGVFENIRKELAKKYARFPYWKELGTYLVLICNSELFDNLEKGWVATLYDKTGLHMNVMLGTVFVDQERFLSSADCTWGLFYSGKHFEAISATVNELCKEMRSKQGKTTDVDTSLR